ncbi:MAG: hypothetical protein OEY55_15830 [Acidimicrobiia bacterium]|nr:hypothetical protein [Acidimicrobiia bacterium]MDH5423271.1 hypothetical protein [Acidimicrobiia bacterium]
MYTVDEGTVRPYEKLGEVTVSPAPPARISLLAVIGVVVVLLAAVVALSLLVGGPATEVHDSWMNVPVAPVGMVHDSWMNTSAF